MKPSSKDEVKGTVHEVKEKIGQVKKVLGH